MSIQIELLDFSCIGLNSLSFRLHPQLFAVGEQRQRALEIDAQNDVIRLERGEALVEPGEGGRDDSPSVWAGAGRYP